MKDCKIAQRECVQLSKGTVLSKTQYADIARLIYETDPYIYPVMFGEGEEGVRCAIRILPAVFEAGKDAMFAKNNLFVLKEGERITGLILWCAGNLSWDTQSILKIARQKGGGLNEENTELVRREYVSSCYEDETRSDCKMLSLINVCVLQEMRGTGAGTFLLNHFIKAHTESPMELTVLSDNAVAIRLYQKFGFEMIREEEGFALIPKKPMCFTMQRKPTPKLI